MIEQICLVLEVHMICKCAKIEDAQVNSQTSKIAQRVIINPPLHLEVFP